MSESESEQAARSVALEQAYVHEVYEQCAEKTASQNNNNRYWPRIYQFLQELEPGALVCDVGCGNGKYLSVNNNIFKVGVDRCKRFTDIARENKKEVLICDNLALPFRDESFDAVLSIAVVHHFATTERRVHALKELARVLRIGGKLVISVWAMEQRHRKFESQDVLVPWSAEDSLHPIFSPTPSNTSSLSSPNETCYSFFRRALQKLAGGRRGSRPWFLDTWQNGYGKRSNSYQDETADVDELPIELRRLEEASITSTKQPDSLSMKSKSLGDILEIQRMDLVRSRSSIPGLCSTLTSDSGIPDTTASYESNRELPVSPQTKRTTVQKQSSMNEELMSTERLQENERVRRNIYKQASLNEEIICKRMSLESLYSGLKSGLTSRITNIEKVSTMSIKNGFVRIFQSWTSSEMIDATNNFKTALKREPSETGDRRPSREDGSDSSKDSSLQSDTSVDSEDSFASVIYVPKQDQLPAPAPAPTPSSKPKIPLESFPKELEPRKKKTNLYRTIPETAEDEEENRKARLNQIKELLKGKAGFASRRPSFPLIKRDSTAVKILPRLLSLELFNPETDDLDSDSSELSTPESVGSVISVISDERYLIKKTLEPSPEWKLLMNGIDRLNMIDKDDTMDFVLVSNDGECLKNISSESCSSQESLPKNDGGGSITYHQFYHVFREGELDQLINKYVENLHIISSYYDHASWCIVAEKVQVWTI